MARFDVECPEDMLKEMEGLFDDVADEMVNAALPEYQKAIQGKLEAHRDTGELIAGIKVKQSKAVSTDAHIGYITVEGSSSTSSYKRGNGKNEPFRNYQKFMALEYGVDGRQPATPFMQSALTSAEPRIAKAMQRVMEERGKGG